MDTTLHALLDEVWRLLISGADPTGARSPYTMMQLATIGVDGLPKVRTVVMRRAFKERSVLSFHTDVRSEKVCEIEHEPHVAIHVGDWNAGIQIRLEGVARPVEDSEERLGVWDASRPHSLDIYRTSIPPGTTIDDPSTRPPATNGFENFCLIDVHVRCIDFLDVSDVVQRRAQFSRRRDAWHGHWVTP